MPTYEYECSKCGGTFEIKQSIKADPLKDCVLDGCGGKGTVHRLISANVGLVFKGAGFYQTDYKKSPDSCPTPSPSAPCPEAPKCEKAQEAKAAGKPSCGCAGGGGCGE